MEKIPGIWQSEGGAVFRLMETGKVKPVFKVGTNDIGFRDVKRDGFEPELQNEYYLRAEMQNVCSDMTAEEKAKREKFLAEHIAKLLNENPPDFASLMETEDTQQG